MPLAVVIPVAAVLALALILTLAWLVGYSPLAPLRPLRASVTEAGDRAADLAAEFWDWLRLGR